MYENITYEDILQRMLDRIPDSMDKREGSIIFDALAPAAVELQLMYIEFDVILKETFADRAGLGSSNSSDEIYANDTIQEKLSLSDRFGITISFMAPDQNKFLEIVQGLVKARGLEIEEEYLFREAKKWELWYNGRSARTAKQFVDWIEGEILDHKEDKE